MRPGLISLFVFLLFAQLSVRAALIYDNGPLNITSGSTALSITGARTADDFVLASPGTVEAIRFWLDASSEPNFGGTVSYAIYEDAAGSLGSLIASGQGNPVVNVIALEPSLTDVPQLDLTLAAPVALPVGSYWLELHEGPTLTTRDGSPVYWLTRSGVTGNARLSSVPALPSSNIELELGFQLSGTAIPEPSGGLLMLSALGVFALLRKR